MLCAIYKSSKKSDTYLYLRKRDQFDLIPDPLREMFGTPLFVMMLPLDKANKLANADKAKVQAELEQQGFYLQLPPPEENLLKTHLAELKKQGVNLDE